LAAAQEAGAPTLNYGLFLNAVINFLIVALVIFLLVRSLNRLLNPPVPPAAPTTKECPHCLSTIPLKATRCAHCTSDLTAAK
jgi:large conductance mechanosensitive channel